MSEEKYFLMEGSIIHSFGSKLAWERYLYDRLSIENVFFWNSAILWLEWHDQCINQNKDVWKTILPVSRGAVNCRYRRVPYSWAAWQAVAWAVVLEHLAYPRILDGTVDGAYLVNKSATSNWVLILACHLQNVLSISEADLSLEGGAKDSFSFRMTSLTTETRTRLPKLLLR